MGYKRDHDVSPYSDDKVKHKIIKNLDDVELDSSKIQELNVLPYIFFIAALFFSFFSYGSWTYPVFTWIFPIFLLRGFRLLKPIRSIILGWVIFFISNSIIFENILPTSLLGLHIYTALIAFPLLLPFIIDKILSKYYNGLSSTFIFPLATVAVHYLISLADPYRAMISPAYSQIDFPAFSQILTLTGMGGILFFISWFAALINYIWDKKFQWKLINKTVIGFTTLILILNIAGYIRLNYAFDAEKNFRVSILNNSGEKDPVYLENIKRIRSGKFKDVDWEKGIDPYFAKINQRLINKTINEAKAGAKLIVWAELNSFIRNINYNSFLNKIQNAAKENSCFVAFGLGIFHSDKTAKNFFENKMILIDPLGKIILDFEKRRTQYKASNPLPIVETSIGKISTALSFDIFDSHTFLQWRSQKPDLLIISSNGWNDKWSDMDKLQLEAARARAIEHGITIIKSTEKGISAIIDPRGNILAKMDYNIIKPERSLSIHVPLDKSRSVYLLAGNAFNFLSIILLVGLSIFKLITLRKKES